MANITGALISVELALFLKAKCDDLPKDAFRCPSCHMPLRAHGGPGTPHFEHNPGNPGCLLSHKS